MKQKLLFICSQNKLRSPTAEAVFSDSKFYEVRSAGLNNDAEIQLSAEDIDWAEIIFVMEQIHKKKLKQRFREYIKNQRIICMGIPDNYDYLDEELIQIFKTKVPTYLS